MFLDTIDLTSAVAILPIIGAIAIRDLWARRTPRSVEVREERARLAHREAMRATQDALIAANAAHRTREEFLARMSHELRTPLNAVIGFSRVLESNKAGNLRAEDIDLLRRVRLGGEQLLRLVENVLDHAHQAGSALTLDANATDLVETVNSVLDDYRPVAALKGLFLTSVVPVSAPPLAIDATRIRHVIEYLVDNAVKFTSTGGVHLTLATDAGTGLPSRLVVADTGVGIAAERMAQIFEPFEQLSAGLDRSQGGAGLGLPLARRLCDAMRCRLAVDSEPGHGSRFTIHFPRRPGG